MSHTASPHGATSPDAMEPSHRRRARVISATAALVVVTIAVACGAPDAGRRPPDAATAPHDLVLRGVHVVDVADGSIRRDMSIHVRGNRIVAVAPTLDVPPGAATPDVRGRYVVPGLWDMHAHVGAGERWQGPAYVAAGVVAVRDMGSTLDDLARWRRAAPPDAPRIVGGGPIVVGALDDADPRVLGVRTPDEGRRVVARLAAAGAAHVKVYDWVDRGTYFAIAEAARRRGLQLVGHLPLQVTPEEAIQAGQASIEHVGNAFGGMLLHVSADPTFAVWAAQLVGAPFDPANLTGSWPPDRIQRLIATYDTVRVARLAARLATAGVFVTPTLASAASWVGVPPDAALRDPRRATLPAEHRAVIDTLIVTARRAPPSAEAIAAQRAWFALQQRFIRDLQRGGVRMLAGSDFAPWVGAYPGVVIHDELEALVAAGFTPLDALRAATLHPAAYFGGADVAAAVAVGARADLVLVDRDPRTDVRHLRRVHAVLADGRWYGPTGRDSLLRDARAAAATVTSPR